ncbi:MAG: hypothetical protein QJR07_10155 [Acetobacteraceae bacterium]|nr:hypothetical protein [Acetobacteraceae bacterium]
MSEQRADLRYSDDVEKRRPDEDATIDRIIAAMRRTSESAAGQHGHAMRASAKSHGLLKGELQVLDDLPEPLRQGLFATPGSYPVIVRMPPASSPPSRGSDKPRSSPRR